MELLDVVDINGEYTGETLDRESIHDQNKIHWEIAVLIVNSNNEVLIQKRNPNRRFAPNKWETCAGHVESGETLLDATLRELQEELGIKCNADDLNILIEKEPNIKETNSNLRRYYWLSLDKKVDEFVVQKEEISEIKWVSIDKIVQDLKDGSNEYTIKADKIYILEILKKVIGKKGE